MRKLNDLLSIFEEKYNRSFNSISFHNYIKIVLIATPLISIVVLGISYLYFNAFLATNNEAILKKSILNAVFSFIIILAMFILYPNYKENKDKLEIDKGLIYTISNMIILANCGFSVDRMFSRAADIEQNKSIKKLMTNLLADIKFRGYNLEQALERLIVRNPSQTFSEILRGISNASWTSGDLKDILSYHFRNIEQIQKDETENMINSLTVLSEIYVALMVIAPIMIIIMFTLISVLNGTKPTSTISILNSITFILLPFVGVGFIVILDTMRGSD